MLTFGRSSRPTDVYFGYLSLPMNCVVIVFASILDQTELNSGISTMLYRFKLMAESLDHVTHGTHLVPTMSQ